MLSYVEPLPKKKTHLANTFEWSIAQYEELQLHALVALSILLPRSLDEYFEYQIGTRLLMFYEWTINKGKITMDIYVIEFIFIQMINIKVKEIVFSAKVVEIINKLK